MPVRHLGEAERPAVERLLDRDPYGGAPVAERVAGHRLGGLRECGQIYGYGSRRHLEALCWFGNQITPVLANAASVAASVAAFADVVAAQRRQCSSIVGRADAVLALWDRLAPHWGAAREVRPCQPLLIADAPPAVAADPGVRLVRDDEIDLLFPAAVEMYTEEIGVSPLAEGGGAGYRGRVVDLVRERRAYARLVDGRVIFKAELGVVTRHTAQIQGVWVHPAWRGRGVGRAAMAAVVRDALRRVAPAATLYVNDYNHAARRVYARCGFRRIGDFATILF